MADYDEIENDDIETIFKLADERMYANKKEMKVTKEDLQNVAVLSRLAIPADQEDKYIDQMDKILTYMDNLSELDTENVKPTTYALPMQNVFRKDEVKASLDREAALANAPLKEDGYFKVPKVLED
jgi:aspartyl-tRNA(Asn)/glutamyl-tRNA(Gln) amidotransferase subunit C